LLKQALTGLGKAFVVIMGLSYGAAKALEVFHSETTTDDSGQNFASAAEKTAETSSPQFNDLDQRLARLEKSVEALAASVETAVNQKASRGSENYVTRSELSAAMEQFGGTLDTDIARRFDIQNRSVQSLRTMVARTDALLEQVLETIESSGIPA
jgi:DNA anti-recombination protein RmuC